MTLKARVAIAMAAIAVIHVCFQVIPEKYCATPRLRPAAYETALDIFKSRFGGDTVASGVITIPEREIVVPYRGLAISNSLIPRLAMRMSPEGTGVLLRDSEGRSYGGRITYERARSIWGCLAYIEFATTSDREQFNPAKFGRTVGGTLLVGLDAPRPKEDGRRARALKLHVEEMTPDDVIRDEARCAVIEALVRECGSTDSAVFIQAAAIVLPALTRPQSDAEGYALEAFLDKYVEGAGAAAMPVILELEKSGKSPGLPPMPGIEKVPKLKEFIVSVYGKKRPGGPVAVEAEKKVLSATEIESRKKRMEALASEAFPVNPDYHQALEAEKARRLIASVFPEEWRELLAANYDKIPAWETSEYVASEDKARAAGVDAVRRLSEDPQFSGQARAVNMLYRLTKDHACIETLERMVMDCASTDAEKAKEAFWGIARLSVEEPGSADYAATARRILRAACPPNWDLGWSAVSAMPYRVEGTMSLVDDLINAPEKALSDEYKRGTPNKLLPAAMEAAAKYGMKWETNPLVTFVAGLNPEDDPQFYYSALECLTGCWDVRAEPLLVEIREREKRSPTPSLMAIHQTKSKDPFDLWLKRKIIYNKIESMRDLAAVDYYLALTPEDKALVGPGSILTAVPPSAIRKLIEDERFDGTPQDIAEALRMWSYWPPAKDDIVLIRERLKERKAKK